MMVLQFLDLLGCQKEEPEEQRHRSSPQHFNVVPDPQVLIELLVLETSIPYIIIIDNPV